MKLHYKASIALFILLLFCLNITLLADDRTRNFESRVIDSFDVDPVSKWVVKGSKFIEAGYPVVTKVAAFPRALFGKNRDNADLNCLGIKAAFQRKGYNFLEIIPAAPATADTKDKDVIYVDDSGKKWISLPLQLPGRSKTLDLWVWGSNYDYYIEAHLRDYQGGIHVFKLGDLQYTGWKNLYVDIPTSIPQSEPYLPSLKKLELVKLMIWTRPEERVTEFYVYIDHLKILTDLFETRYDGDELEDPVTLKDIWK